MPVDEVLVSVDHADGTAAVMVDDEGVSLSGYADEGSGTFIEDYQPVREGLTRRRMVYGGLLPPGATAVALLDATGAEHPAAVAKGAWIGVVDDGDRLDGCKVRYKDVQGEFVAPPLPPHWPREPVEDATQDCPVCGSRAWDVVTALDGSRGSIVADDWGEQPGRVVVCRRCGHEVQMGAMIRIEGPPDPAGGDAPELSDAALALELWLTPWPPAT
jgi:hypothetical protein